MTERSGTSVSREKSAGSSRTEAEATNTLELSDKEHIVEKGNYLKFSKGKETELKRKLLDTQERELVEVSLRDPRPSKYDLFISAFSSS
jgi:predicted NAD-dependent protein-ADP-ribosyltransferase YbiA (DUF1768 family)